MNLCDEEKETVRRFQRLIYEMDKLDELIAGIKKNEVETVE